MEESELYMHRCLELAALGFGNVAPNPLVGAVLVKDGKIIGEGYHQQYGKAHAEVNCINSVKAQDQHLIADATLYVNLEPCSHFGKTPPCADLLIQQKVKQVVIGSLDPNPLVAGKGLEKLKQAGTLVNAGVLDEECNFLNRRFFTFHTKQRPYVILKFAQSEDGFMALLEQKKYWLTNEESVQLVHKWRSEEPAIMVGTSTVLADDPQLTVRAWQGKNPLRIAIDKDLKLPLSKKIFDSAADTIIYNAVETICKDNLHFVKIDFEVSILPQIMKELFERNIQSVIIEGGAFLLQSIIAENLWDEARVFTTTQLFERGLKAPKVSGELLSTTFIQQDRLEIFINKTTL